MSNDELKTPVPKPVIAAVIIGIVLFILMQVSSNSTPATPGETASNNAAPTVGATSDVDRLSSFHRQLLQVENGYARANDVYRASINTSDRYSLYSSTRKFYGELASASSYVNDHLKSPELRNPEASKHVADALESLKSNIRLKQYASTKLMEALDSGDFKPSELDEIKQANLASDASAFKEASDLFAAYHALGVSPDMIDVTNGGVLPKKK